MILNAGVLEFRVGWGAGNMLDGMLEIPFSSTKFSHSHYAVTFSNELIYDTKFPLVSVALV